jgi:capsular exopolysaccharide synthesis family protein
MPERTDHTLHFSEYLRVIRNRMWVIFTIFVLTVGSGYYVTEEIMHKVYASTAQMQVRARNEMAVPGMATLSAQFDPLDFQSEFEIMQSPEMLKPIIQDMHLDEGWSKRVFKLGVQKMDENDAVAYLTSRLNIDFKRGTNIITVTAKSDLPDEAAAIANALVDRYKTTRDVEADEQNNRGVAGLQQDIAQQEKIVEDKRAIVEKMRLNMTSEDVGIVSGSNSTEEQLDRVLDARQHDLAAAKLEAEDREVLLNSVKDLDDDQFVNTLEALGRPETAIATLRQQILGLESDEDNLLKQGFDQNHPRVLAIRAEHDDEVKQLANLIAGARRALAVDAEIATSRVDLLQKEVDDLTAQSTKHQSQQLEPFREAQQEVERQQAILDAFNIRYHQIVADRPLSESPVRIISRAPIPDHPVEPNLMVNMAVSVAAGLFLGVLVAFLIEYLDTSVKTMADAEQLLGLPVLTVIPNRGGPLPLNQPSGRLAHAEGYRILRAKLDLKVANGLGPTVSMVSGGPGEGKSTTLFNLAVVCAQAGQSVALVDCDLRRPTMHDLVNLPNDRGVVNYLRGEGEAIQFIQQTALPKLHVLTAGDMPMAEIGTLAGDKIRAMLHDLKQRYDVVLVDSPPILGISDGSIIAREVDNVILVIQHRRFPREISLRAKRAIEEVHGNCVGMVLNSVAVKSDDSYYYYSNYSDYYKKSDRKKKRSAKARGKEALTMSNGNHDSDDF